MLRYQVAGEFEFHDDFGWLDITHGMTYANAVRWLSAGRSDPDVLRLALWCVFEAHWTGRHEWHTAVGETDGVDVGVADGAPVDALRAAGERLQRHALDDTTSALIVHIHAVKTTTAATEEAVRTRSARPLEAARRGSSTRPSSSGSSRPP